MSKREKREGQRQVVGRRVGMVGDVRLERR